MADRYYVIMDAATPVGATRSLEDAKHTVETLQEAAIGPVTSRRWAFRAATNTHFLHLSNDSARLGSRSRWYVVSVPAGDQA